MPPRQRTSELDVDSSYDGVPTVNVQIDAVPDADTPDTTITTIKEHRHDY